MQSLPVVNGQVGCGHMVVLDQKKLARFVELIMNEGWQQPSGI